MIFIFPSETETSAEKTHLACRTTTPAVEVQLLNFTEQGKFKNYNVQSYTFLKKKKRKKKKKVQEIITCNRTSAGNFLHHQLT